MFKQLIFDCDGVLVDTEIVAAEVVTRVMNGHGVDITVEDYLKECTGRLISEILNILPQETIGDLEKLVLQCEKDIYDHLRPVKGMPDLLPGLPLNKSVVSNSALWQVEKAIKYVGLEKVFGKRYFSSEMVEHPKPAPDVYQYAAGKLKSRSKEILVIEDSKAGVTAARAAGMTVIGFTGASHILAGHETALIKLGATEVASTPEELKSIILKMCK